MWFLFVLLLLLLGLVPVAVAPSPAKKAATFENEPGASMTFHRLDETDDLLRELLRIAHLDVKALDAYLVAEKEKSKPHRLAKKLNLVADEQRVANLVNMAELMHLLYSYCGIFFVANPYIGLLPDTDYDQFVASAKKNWNINIETAVMPQQAEAAAPPKPVAARTIVDRNSSIDEVVLRMSEVSLNTGTTAPVIPSPFQLKAECMLLLDLLSLNADQRDQYIIECAIAQRLLLVAKDGEHCFLNPNVNAKCLDAYDPDKALKSANAILKGLSAALKNNSPGSYLSYIVCISHI